MSRLLCLAVASWMAVGFAVPTAQAGALLLAGSPTYDSATGTGLKDGSVPYNPGCAVNNSGVAVAYATKYIDGANAGNRAVRWDASGTSATELGNLGIYTDGSTYVTADAVNDSGVTVGHALKYVGDRCLGACAVRWDASGTIATELGNIGSPTNGLYALAVNEAGTAVGFANTVSLGSRAVRWDASGAATELGTLGTDASGASSARAYTVNDAGMTVGYSQKFLGDGSVGRRAVRWDAFGTAATELGVLNTDTNGYAVSEAYAANNAGDVVGYAYKYVGDSAMGYRAARWDASGTVATELGNLGIAANGYTLSEAYAINNVGTAVGWANKYVNGNTRGVCAVRWDASGTVTELGNLGVSRFGSVSARACALNDAGAAVGYSTKFVGGASQGNHAVIWLPDTSTIDLNDLGVVAVPAGGTWTLTTAKAISADGFVAGEGTFDPDGDGPLPSYTRLWVAQVGLGGNWTTAVGGTWGRGPNWSTGTPAMQVGNAAFNLNASYTVDLDRDERTQSLTVNAGTVTLNLAGHTLTTDNGLSIASGATLNGTGSIGGNITNGGTLSPGDDVGTLAIGGNLTNTNSLRCEIASLAEHDEIDVSQTFNAGGSIGVSLLGGYAPSNGDRFHLMSFGGLTDNGYAFDFSQATLPTGLQWDTATFATTGAITVVPEPATISMLLIGLAAWIVRPKRKTEK
jgi:hypothetical protein